MRLRVGGSCPRCGSTAIEDHEHTETDCLVARTGWGGW